jgi:hypothetical protein
LPSLDVSAVDDPIDYSSNIWDRPDFGYVVLAITQAGLNLRV